MLAIELVGDGITPNPAATQAVAKACHAAGLLVLTCGTYGNVLRFLPPLVISDEELSRGLDILDGAFASL
jgi:4-aminobutyrate aminotransferase/(S)-3-amino-2-methylpropionate transaminase